MFKTFVQNETITQPASATRSWTWNVSIFISNPNAFLLFTTYYYMYMRVSVRVFVQWIQLKRNGRRIETIATLILSFSPSLSVFLSQLETVKYKNQALARSKQQTIKQSKFWRRRSRRNNDKYLENQKCHLTRTRIWMDRRGWASLSACDRRRP